MEGWMEGLKRERMFSSANFMSSFCEVVFELASGHNW